MRILALILTIASIGIDQLIKVAAESFLRPVGKVELIPGLINLTYVQNYGAAFGILQHQQWFFIVTAVVVCIGILLLFLFYKNHDIYTYAASILMVGGGCGNLIDRVGKGYVIDYLELSFFTPVFNFADCCIVAGGILLLFHLLFLQDSQAKHFKKTGRS